MAAKYSGGGFFFGETSTQRVRPFLTQITANHVPTVILGYTTATVNWLRQFSTVWEPEEGSLSGMGDFFLERIPAAGFDFRAPTSDCELGASLFLLDFLVVIALNHTIINKPSKYRSERQTSDIHTTTTHTLPHWPHFTNFNHTKCTQLGAPNRPHVVMHTSNQSNNHNPRGQIENTHTNTENQQSKLLSNARH